jgi:hypothetical protein
MQVANVRLRLNKVGSDVPLKDVTPAEAMLLHILHGPSCGGSTFGEKMEKIEIIGEALMATDVPDKIEPDKTIPAKPQIGKPGDSDYQAPQSAQVIKGAVLSYKKGVRPRTDVEELTRLRTKYIMAKDKNLKPIIDIVFPDKFNPKLPQTFAEVQWKEAASVPIETASLNYVTGGLTQTITS